MFQTTLPFQLGQTTLPFQVSDQLISVQPQQTTPPIDPLRPPEMDLIRVVQFLADASGCGFWRMAWPSHLINIHQMANVTDSTIMYLQPEWYTGVKAVRIQRQATPHQKRFVQFLKQIQPQYGFRLIYEIDDIVFREDIPGYNKFKFAFESDEIRNTSQEIMEMCDEITVTCPFMQNYYQEKIKKKEVTIIPNFPPKWWIGNHFNKSKVIGNYEQNIKRPRILYAGSGAHFDVDNRVKQRDDFEHVLKAIVDTRHKYRWVFLGAHPLPLINYVRNREIEFHPWEKMYKYPSKIESLDVQMMVAPLQDNTFNRAKSDLKFIEACCFGLPIACQNICTYSDAPLKFNNGQEMLNIIDNTLSNKKQYIQNIQRWRNIAESRFLENDENIGCFMELFTTPYGSLDRKYLKKFNSV